MKRRLVSQVSGLFALALSSSAFAVGFQDYQLGEFYPLSQVDEKVVTEASEAVVYFKGATGFIISPDGYILTNYHVWDGFGDTGKVYRHKTEDGYKETLKIKLITKSQEYDMALYKAELKGELPFLPLRTKAVKVGEEVFILGHPDSKPLRASFGTILAKGLNISGRPSVEYSAQTWWGSSGSPVLDKSGQVVALHWGWDSEGLSNGRLTGVPISLMAKAIPEIDKIAKHESLAPEVLCQDASLFSIEVVSLSNKAGTPQKTKYQQLELRTKSSNASCAAQISTVTYSLHPTFPNPERDGDSSLEGFPIQISAWGMFPMSAEVFFVDGSSLQIEGYVRW
jgi:S1-C subfamily serine protease